MERMLKIWSKEAATCAILTLFGKHSFDLYKLTEIRIYLWHLRTIVKTKASSKERDLKNEEQCIRSVEEEKQILRSPPF